MSSEKNIVDLQAVAALIEDADQNSQSNVHHLPQTTMSPTIEQHQPDQELLETTARIKSQRDLILSRIHKMNSHQNTVSESVFKKVYRDYQLQLDNINRLLNEKKSELKQELRNLFLAHQKVEQEIKRHQEILEEARFRHYLEEFSEEQYKEVEEFEAREISKLQTDAGTLQSFMKVHEELFDPEDLGKKPAPTPQVAPSSPQSETQTMYVPLTENSNTSSVSTPAENHTQIPQIPKAEPELTQSASPVVENSMPAQTESHAEEISEKTAVDSDQDFNEDLNDKLDLTDSDIPHEVPTPSQEAVAHAESQDYFDSPPENTPEISMSSHLEVDEEPNQNQESANSDLDMNSEEKSFLTDSDASVSDILEDMDIDSQLSNSLPTDSQETEPAGDSYKLVFKPGELNSDIGEFELKDNTSIGRSPSNDLVLRAPKMSRQHAAINKYKDQFIVIDLKSSNGVYVNGRKIDEHPLEIGDELSIGGYKMVFEKN